MRDLLLIPFFAPFIAQAAPVASEWERLGITGLSIAATIFVWKYFNSKQDAKDQLAAKERDAKDLASATERDRLLKEANDKNQQIIDLLKQQVEDSRKMATGETRMHTILENTMRHPVPVKPVIHEP